MQAVGSTSFHKVFAENLRRMTLSRGTISRTCEAIGINRQQFNRYLSASSFPSAAILARIAAHFNVSEVELLQIPPEWGSKHSAGNTDLCDMIGDLPMWLCADLGGMVKQASGGLFRPGCYFAYYPWPPDPKKVVRSVVVINRKHNIVSFRRYTRLRAIASNSHNTPNAKHRGLVIENGGRTFFLGRNTRGYGELSLSSFGATASLGTNIFHGLALVMTPWAEPTALRTTMTYEGGYEMFRSLLREASIGPSGHEAIPADVLYSVTSPLDTSVPRIDPFGAHMARSNPSELELK